MSEEEAAEEEEAVPRRDPSEKQEPHTVMWGINTELFLIMGELY